MNTYDNNGYTDFSIAMKFYELWRAISMAFMDFLKAALRIFGVDVEEGKSTTGV